MILKDKRDFLPALPRAKDVRTYLLRQGWKLRRYPRRELLVFEGPRANDGQAIIQVLPVAEHLADYRQRLHELITALAVIENRPANDVLNEISQRSASNHRSATTGHKKP